MLNFGKKKKRIIELVEDINHKIETIVILQKGNDDEKTIEENSKLKKYLKSEINLSNLVNINLDLQIGIDFLEFTEDIPNYFEYLILRLINENLSILNLFSTALNSAISIIKENVIEDNFFSTISSMIETHKEIIKKYYEIHLKSIENLNIYIIKPVEKVKAKGENLSFIYKPVSFINNLVSVTNKWFIINDIKDTNYYFQDEVLKVTKIKIFRNIDDIPKSFMKKALKGKNTISLKNLAQNDVIIEFKRKLLLLAENFIENYANKKENIEKSIEKSLLFYLFNKKFISADEKQFWDSLQKKNTRSNLKDLLEKELSFTLANIYPNTNKDLKNQISINPIKALPQIILEKEKKIEQNIINLEISEEEKKSEYKTNVLKLFNILNIITDWFLGLKEFLTPFESVIRNYIRVLSHIRDELNRRNDDLSYYINSIIEQNIRSNLDEEIDKKIEDLESLLKKYENETSNIILKEIPQIKEIDSILDKFKENFSEIGNQVNEIFKHYEKDSNYNFYSNIKRWEEKYEDITNKVKFVISALFITFFEKFNKIIDKEQKFLSNISNFSTIDASLDIPFSYEMIMPEKLTEKQLRDRIHIIKGKINELDNLKDLYLNEKKKYEDLIKGYIDERKDIVSKQCVVCHKPIDLIEDKFIKCNFCNRMMHYLCGAWWLEKHNTCPVCNNSFLIPDSGLYEIDYYDAEEDNNDNYFDNFDQNDEK